MMFHFICLLAIFGSTTLNGVKAYYKPGGNSDVTECVDRSPSCFADAANKLCDAFGEDYKRNVCPESCGICPCTDRASEYECDQYKKHNLCKDGRYHTRIWCRKTCEYCWKA
uniref:ShKT-domain containing protein n=1 Tax=Teladorsagia circumcincta TaxID=45464 RepID=A0A238GSV5_TELCI|nr:ShKT-domain containing protein [Teladorsagia circumcincta]